MDIDVKRTAIIFKAFCDENRIRILQLLQGGEKCACILTDALGMLYSEMKCSLNMPVCCADNAEEITELHFTEGITSAEKPVSSKSILLISFFHFSTFSCENQTFWRILSL